MLPGLPAIVLFLIMPSPPAWAMAPPMPETVFPLIVLLVMFRVASSKLTIPPPMVESGSPPGKRLLLIVLPVITNVPVLAMPAPALLPEVINEKFPSMVLFVSVNVPELSMPTPKMNDAGSGPELMTSWPETTTSDRVTFAPPGW